MLTTLDELGLASNTLVVFTSDNGGHPEFSANGPLRGSKWNLYEGGVRVPWIVRWPGRVPAGATNDAPFIGTDLLPTLAAATGSALPPGVPLDGRNVLPLWRGQRPTSADTERPFVWHFPYYHPETGFAAARPAIGVDDFAVSRTYPQSALRAGDWKYIPKNADTASGIGRGADPRDRRFSEAAVTEPLLFNLATDPAETTNLAGKNPAKVAEMSALLESIRAATPSR